MSKQTANHSTEFCSGFGIGIFGQFGYHAATAALLKK
jgi:hypothetical protein